MLTQLDHSANKRINADVCIAGAGPAGIVLALTFAELGLSSVLLEAGPLERPGPEGRDPYRGEVSGLPYPLSGSRMRFFGGTSSAWGGWCKPLDAADFTRRSSAPLPSWPISLTELEPHYPRSLEWCEIANGDFQASSSVENPDDQLLFSGDPEFSAGILRFSPPTRFGKRYREDIENSEPAHCIYNASLVSLEFKGDSISAAHAANLDGDKLEIRAEKFILAMGGIEVTRFLLHLAATTTAGFGTGSNLLGSCFMDHFGFHPGYLAAPAGLKYFRHEYDGSPLMPVITATQDLQQELDLPSICMTARPDAPSQHLPTAYFENPGILGDKPADAVRYRLGVICEPTAHVASRISLSDDKDAFGMGRVNLDWQILDEDYLKVEQFLRHFELGVGRRGLGRVQRTRRFEGEIRRKLSVGWHHMGTTRMSDHHDFGVVDTNCRVWGSSNLYVASSSVFPRVGYSNPTLTILALADRMARHINGASG